MGLADFLLTSIFLFSAGMYPIGLMIGSSCCCGGGIDCTLEYRCRVEGQTSSCQAVSLSHEIVSIATNYATTWGNPFAGGFACDPSAMSFTVDFRYWVYPYLSAGEHYEWSFPLDVAGTKIDEILETGVITGSTTGSFSFVGQSLSAPLKIRIIGWDNPIKDPSSSSTTSPAMTLFGSNPETLLEYRSQVDSTKATNRTSMNAQISWDVVGVTINNGYINMTPEALLDAASVEIVSPESYRVKAAIPASAVAFSEAFEITWTVRIFNGTASHDERHRASGVPLGAIEQPPENALPAGFSITPTPRDNASPPNNYYDADAETLFLHTRRLSYSYQAEGEVSEREFTVETQVHALVGTAPITVRPYTFSAVLLNGDSDLGVSYPQPYPRVRTRGDRYQITVPQMDGVPGAVSLSNSQEISFPNGKYFHLKTITAGVSSPVLAATLDHSVVNQMLAGVAIAEYVTQDGTSYYYGLLSSTAFCGVLTKNLPVSLLPQTVLVETEDGEPLWNDPCDTAPSAVSVPLYSSGPLGVSYLLYLDDLGLRVIGSPWMHNDATIYLWSSPRSVRVLLSNAVGAVSGSTLSGLNQTTLLRGDMFSVYVTSSPDDNTTPLAIQRNTPPVPARGSTNGSSIDRAVLGFAGFLPPESVTVTVPQPVAVTTPTTEKTSVGASYVIETYTDSQGQSRERVAFYDSSGELLGYDSARTYEVSGFLLDNPWPTAYETMIKDALSTSSGDTLLGLHSAAMAAPRDYYYSNGGTEGRSGTAHASMDCGGNVVVGQSTLQISCQTIGVDTAGSPAKARSGFRPYRPGGAGSAVFNVFAPSGKYVPDLFPAISEAQSTWFLEAPSLATIEDAGGEVIYDLYAVTFNPSPSVEQVTYYPGGLASQPVTINVFSPGSPVSSSGWYEIVATLSAVASVGPDAQPCDVSISADQVGPGDTPSDPDWTPRVVDFGACSSVAGTDVLLRQNEPSLSVAASTGWPPPSPPCAASSQVQTVRTTAAWGGVPTVQIPYLYNIEPLPLVDWCKTNRANASIIPARVTSELNARPWRNYFSKIWTEFSFGRRDVQPIYQSTNGTITIVGSFYGGGQVVVGYKLSQSLSAAFYETRVATCDESGDFSFTWTDEQPSQGGDRFFYVAGVGRFSGSLTAHVFAARLNIVS